MGGELDPKVQRAIVMLEPGLSPDHPVDERVQKAQIRKARRNRLRKGRDDMLRSLGLKKVRGALGGTYWE